MQVQVVDGNLPTRLMLRPGHAQERASVQRRFGLSCGLRLFRRQVKVGSS